MGEKWVDNAEYFGPDRRRAATGLRLRERRREDQAGDPPPLGALLRRERVSLLAMTTGEHRDHTLKLNRAALAAADRLHMAACAEKIREAGRAIAVIDPRDHAAVARADSLIVQAMALNG